MKKTTSCPVCESTILKTVFELSSQPLARYGLCENQQDAINAHKNNLKIFECKGCGVMFNEEFDYKKIDYTSSNIQESRVFSPRILQFMNDGADVLIKKIDLEGELVLEIGCGEGYFLKQFMDHSSVIGFEPSTEGEIAKGNGIKVFDEYYDPDRDYGLKPKLIILRQVLEHLINPRHFIKAFYDLLHKGDGNGFLYMEVPNSNTTKLHNRFYDFYYEHYLYFTTGSLVRLVESCGFKVVECGEQFNGEIISILCETTKNNLNNLTFTERKSHIFDEINSRLKSGKKVVAWGTAGSGSALLNSCGFDSSLIKYVIDSDVRKQNKFVPGTGQLVVSPIFFLDSPPDCILILSQFHKKDISDQIKKIYSDKVEILMPEEL